MSVASRGPSCCIREAILAKFLVLLVLLGTSAAGLWWAAQPEQEGAVCAAAGTAINLPDDLKYTGGFQAGRDLAVFTAYEQHSKSLLTPESSSYLTRMNSLLQAKGTTLAFLIVPPRAVVLASFNTSPLFNAATLRANYSARLEQLQRTGMIVPDTLHALEALKPEDTFFMRDTHWTPAGAEAVAQAVAKAVPNMVDAQAGYSTRVTGVAEHKGNYSFPLNKLCGTPIVPERLEQRETTSASVSLLDDSVPEIALVGSSFSNRSGQDLFNFAGALRQAFGRDVLNAAVDGGGFDASILAYLESASFRQHPPRLLIWESMFEMSHNQPQVYRQVLPTIAGQCAQPLIEQSLELQANASASMAIPAALNISGQSYYAVLTFSDLSLLHFGIELVYADQQIENFEFNRSNRTQHDGRYYLELSPAYASVLRELRLPAGQGRVQVQLCAYPR